MKHLNSKVVLYHRKRASGYLGPGERTGVRWTNVFCDVCHCFSLELVDARGGQIAARLSNIVSNSDPDRLSGRARSWLSYGLTEGPNFGSKVHTPQYKPPRL